MANISQNIRHTSNTLKMDGMAWTKAFTTTYASYKCQLIIANTVEEMIYLPSYPAYET